MIEDNPWLTLDRVCASERSVGKRYEEGVNWILSTEIPDRVAEMSVEAPNPKNSDVDIVISALPSDIARKIEPSYAEEGLVVSSNTSALRMEPDVPLVIPEINPSHLELIERQKEERKWGGFIVTNPNCSTIGLALPLKPIHDHYHLVSVFVTTMQAVSGAGLPGIPSLKIADNIIPYIESEEKKVQTETLKILGSLENGVVEPAPFELFASCNRVPVTDGHLKSVFVLLEEDTTIEELTKMIRSFRGIPQQVGLPTSPEEPIIVRSEIDRPQTRLDRNAGSRPGMAVSVGRLRSKNGRTFGFSVLSHNTIRGAAGAAILNAELLKYKKLI
ncbi:MAG: aspartate-semialdehyde dehydrogenase [Candidatus Heimdallarchaeota archaeon]